MINIYFYLFEAGAIISFLLLLFKERKNREIFESIILAFVYGLLLEIFDVYLSGSYSYGKEFFLQIFNIPLAIAAGWALIYYAARKTSECYGLKWWQAPFLMALIALSIDMAMDAVAIRIGFWSWRIPFSEEWFGVPYDNFVGWLAVIWTFGLFINLSRQNFISKRGANIIRYLAVIVSPLLLSLQITLYVSLSAIFSGKFTANEIIGFYARKDFGYAYYPEVQQMKMYFFVLIVLVLSAYLARVVYLARKNIGGQFDIFSFVSIFSVHLFFLAMILIERIYKQIPLFIFLSLAMLFFHIAINFIPKNLRRDKICH